MDRIQEEEESRKALMDEFDNDEDTSIRTILILMTLVRMISDGKRHR